MLHNLPLVSLCGENFSIDLDSRSPYFSVVFLPPRDPNRHGDEFDTFSLRLFPSGLVRLLSSLNLQSTSSWSSSTRYLSPSVSEIGLLLGLRSRLYYGSYTDTCFAFSLLNLFIFFLDTDEKYFAPEVINCKDDSKSFTRDRLNDNFCDCVDGTDEPGMLFVFNL